MKTNTEHKDISLSSGQRIFVCLFFMIVAAVISWNVKPDTENKVYVYKIAGTLEDLTMTIDDPSVIKQSFEGVRLYLSVYTDIYFFYVWDPFNFKAESYNSYNEAHSAWIRIKTYCNKKENK